MATIAEHVGFLRGIIDNQSDDSQYTDEEIYHAFNNAANRLMWQKLQRFDSIPERGFHTFAQIYASWAASQENG